MDSHEERAIRMLRAAGYTVLRRGERGRFVRISMPDLGQSAKPKHVVQISPQEQWRWWRFWE